MSELKVYRTLDRVTGRDDKTTVVAVRSDGGIRKVCECWTYDDAVRVVNALNEWLVAETARREMSR